MTAVFPYTVKDPSASNCSAGGFCLLFLVDDGHAGRGDAGLGVDDLVDLCDLGGL